MLKNNLQIEKNQKFNIIFLDIDGVMYKEAFNDPDHMRRMQANDWSELNSHPDVAKKMADSSFPALDNLKKDELMCLSKVVGFSKEAIHYLQKLCVQFNAKIVVSSSWREGRSLSQLKMLFSIYDFSDYIIDCTPLISENHRGREIAAWLAEHVDQVKSFVILDDNKYDIPDRFDERFVYCHTLFSQDLFEKAVSIFAIPLTSENVSAKLSDMQCLKFRLAIAENNITIRFQEKQKVLIKHVEIAIKGTENNSGAWINMHDFLMCNDWDATMVGSYSDISYEEQRAVTVYVCENDDYLKIKALFNPYENITTYDPNNDLEIHKIIKSQKNRNQDHNTLSSYKYSETQYSDDEGYSVEKTAKEIQHFFQEERKKIERYNDKVRKKYIVAYLNQLVLMQSAYNKKRFSYSCEKSSAGWGAKVYRNVNHLDEELLTHPLVPWLVSSSSVASTTTDGMIYLHRKHKLIIQAGNDAVPLFDIIVDENLRKLISLSEKEHFLGVRPFFIKLEKQEDAAGLSPAQEKQCLRHLNQIDMSYLRYTQAFFRNKLSEERKYQMDSQSLNHTNLAILRKKAC